MITIALLRWLIFCSGLCAPLQPERKLTMLPKTQANVFIQTVEEMRDHEVQRKKTQLRLRVNAYLKSLVPAPQADAERGKRRTTRTLDHGN
ncbi:hypothetical protein [Roseovarius sp. D0-M9]|uniref:hypothetical protein n=1 Tax=Roseovarius sp. D0-M9 TaxID=3127117 RepID=UPI00300FCDB5